MCMVSFQDDVEAIIACLDVLSTMFMSIEALKDSGVARTVMAVRKHSNKEAASLANQLIQVSVTSQQQKR